MTRTIAARRLVDLLGDVDRAPAYAGLAAGIRALITDGRVAVGTRLPSERDLTAVLDLSRTTVARAYAELRDAGFLVSRQGSGSVAALPPGRGHRGDHLLAPADGAGDAIDLSCAAPTPVPGLQASYARALDALPGHLGGTGYFPSGTSELRRAVAASYEARGLVTDPDQVVIVPGALAGVALSARSVLGPGDRVVVESPTYPNAIATLSRAGGRVIGTDLAGGPGGAGDVEGWTRTLRQVLPRVAYLIPDFHNPTGALRSDEERQRLAATMRLTRTTAIVDETMVDLNLDDRAMPAPFAAYADGAITVGTLSKSFWGGLRMGWVRVPERHLDAVLTERLAYDCGTPVLEQLVAADLLRTGAPMLAERLRTLRESRDAALAGIAEHLPDWSVTAPAGGLCLWCRLPGPLSTALTVRAREHGVLLAPGPAFAPEGGLDRFVRVPFTQPAPVVADAVRRLGRAWTETLASPDVGPAPSPVLVA